MGNTVRRVSSLGTSDPCSEEEEGQEKLGDALDGVDSKAKLGDVLTGMFEEVDVDSVESVRELREE